MKKIVFCFLILTGCSAYGQTLRFSNHRKPGIPEYAVLRIGPFYSDITFSQSVGYRYTRTSGAGTEFVFDNERGRIKKDGSEMPLITSLRMRNYLLISRNADLDFSVELAYESYPLGTQEDVFALRLPEEGIYGNLSTTLALTRFLRVTAYERISYETDYIDTRGYIDQYGGRGYEHLENNIGLRSDWKMSKNQNLGADIFRTDLIPMDDEFEDQERTSYNESLTYENRIFEGLLVGAGMDFSQNYYPDPERDDTFIQDFNVFLEGSRGAGIPLTKVTTVSASLGYAYAYDESDARADDDQTGSLTASAGIATQLRPDLKHSLTYSKGLRRGFRSDFEDFNSLSYQLGWERKGRALEFFADYDQVKPSYESRGDYSDMTYGIHGQYPLYLFMKFHAQTSYNIRDNSGVDAPGGLDATVVNDYETWSTRAGTTIDLAKGLGFEFYAQHVERYSDSSLLTYDRDIIAGTFTFKYRF